MNKEDLIEYLKENLKITSEDKGYFDNDRWRPSIEVYLTLGDCTISKTNISD